MKKVIIVGGDKVAYNLIGLLSEEKVYDVRVIDTRIEICERIANNFDVKVFHGDGTNVDILERAEAMGADVLIALTGTDESNLVACQIAKMHFDVALTIAKVNNPRNATVLKILGVDRIFSSTQMIAKMIDQEVSYSGMSLAYNIPGTTKAIVSVPLHPLSGANGKTLAEYSFIGDSRVVL
ncbi:MAG: TrkA family potassium uptake protein, partial [Clostridiaceae bacterium]|nr:TrkA family potassium uptake protein [Clostridiaceae bacterium]